MVPQSRYKEMVNRLKIKIFLIGHIYEVKVIGITLSLSMLILIINSLVCLFVSLFVCLSVCPLGLPKRLGRFQKFFACGLPLGRARF